jgi:hypothetical protein
MGRPTKMTPAILERLRHAFSIGATDEEACAYARIGTSTLYDYQKANPEFSEEKSALKKDPILKAKQTVVDSLNEVKDAQWYLERKVKDEFSLRKEISGEDGEPIKVIWGGNEDSKD